MSGSAAAGASGMAYRQFLAALPAAVPPDRLRGTPLSSFALDLRVEQLPPADRLAVHALRRRLWPSRSWADGASGTGSSTAALPAAVKPLLDAKERIDAGLAALRARRLGMAAPDWQARYGGLVGGRVARNCDQPHLGLPEEAWIDDARAYLAAADWAGLERLRLATLWTWLDRVAVGHHWDLVAVLVAVTRFDIANMLGAWDGAAAKARIAELAAGWVEDGDGRTM